MSIFDGETLMMCPLLLERAFGRKLESVKQGISSRANQTYFARGKNKKKCSETNRKLKKAREKCKIRRHEQK